jgi:hypothetical protein
MTAPAVREIAEKIRDECFYVVTHGMDASENVFDGDLAASVLSREIEPLVRALREIVEWYDVTPDDVARTVSEKINAARAELKRWRQKEKGDE